MADEKKPGRGGARPGSGPKRFDIDLVLVENAASIGCTVDEIAAVVGCARQTFFNHINADPEFQAAIDRGRANGRATLRRLQWQGANDGNTTMLIWLGKQMLAQRDRFPEDNTPPPDTTVKPIAERIRDALIEIDGLTDGTPDTKVDDA